jgi:hypothetical protein
MFDKWWMLNIDIMEIPLYYHMQWYVTLSSVYPVEKVAKVLACH